MLAAVAVAGGAAVAGLPQAEAAFSDTLVYFEKVDESGQHIGGSEWELEFVTPSREKLAENLSYGSLSAEEKAATLEKMRIIDNWSPRSNGQGGLPEFDYWKSDLYEGRFIDRESGRFIFEDMDPRPGHFAFIFPYEGAGPGWNVRLTEAKTPDGYTSCGNSPTHMDFSSVEEYEVTGPESDPTYVLREDANVKFTQLEGRFTPVADRRFAPGNYYRPSRNNFQTIDWEEKGDNPLADTPFGKMRNDFVIPEKSYSGKPYPTYYYYSDGSEVEGGGFQSIYSLKAAVNCKIPEPTTVTETVTETPEPSTTTVTPPTTTVTLPSTVTTTVTPPATTVTETPKTETTTATTTESATTTVTETPQTETVTETPQRETVTLTPEKETETVTETPQKETVTETPKTETVTHTPNKETVTETPKASTETKTSTVTAPQVTVTETPKQVTETTTLPQKTVTQQVPTTVVENKTETVKVPPVTVTTTEKQEPTTVTATPEKVTETVKVPGEKTTVVETKPGEPTTVRETVTETPKQPDVPAVVEQPTPNAPVVDTPDTPVIPGAFSGTAVWDEDRSKTVNNGDERIPGLTVVAYKDGKEIARTTTDENGFYKFDGLEPGEYGIAVYGPDGGELFFEDKAATVVAGQEDTGNDWGFVREDAPAPVEEGKPATPVETVRQTLATTGANSYALAGLGAVLAALVALAVVSRRKTAIQ